MIRIFPKEIQYYILSFIFYAPCKKTLQHICYHKDIRWTSNKLLFKQHILKYFYPPPYDITTQFVLQFQIDIIKYITILRNKNTTFENKNKLLTRLLTINNYYLNPLINQYTKNNKDLFHILYTLWIQL
jgi:hypothetical protein